MSFNETGSGGTSGLQPLDYPAPPPVSHSYAYPPVGPPIGSPQYPTLQAPKTSVLAIVALVFSCFGAVVFPIIPSIIGIVLAVIALGKIKRSNGWIVGRGLAVAAVWVGSLTIAAFTAMILAFYFGMTALFSTGVLDLEEPCNDSAWYQETRSQVDGLVPGGMRTELDFEPECWSGGGEFELTATASAPEAPTGMRAAVEAAARESGWTGSDINPGCMQKTIAGQTTYLSGESYSDEARSFWLAVSTDFESSCAVFDDASLMA